MTTVEISREHVQFEVQALVLRYVCAGTISAEEAEAAASAGVPIAARAVKELRVNGRTVAEVNTIFAEKVAAATRPAERFAAELLVAVWTGMQADFRATFGREIGA